VTVEALAQRLARPRGKDSVSNHLRKAGGLSPAAIAILREIGDPPPGPEKLARRIKAIRLKVTGVQGLERAISSAGGVSFSQVDERLMLTACPGVFVAGEMLDWEAPTGGYLLTASLASGVVAGAAWPTGSTAGRTSYQVGRSENWRATNPSVASRSMPVPPWTPSAVTSRWT
jgi:predicted flavoprotein YhiN